MTETHFSEADISGYPRVLTKGLKELRSRIEELATVEYVPKRLYIICLERKGYLNAVEKHCERINDANIWKNFKTIEKRIKEK